MGPSTYRLQTRTLPAAVEDHAIIGGQRPKATGPRQVFLLAASDAGNIWFRCRGTSKAAGHLAISGP